MNTNSEILTIFINFANDYVFEVAVAIFIILIFTLFFNLRLCRGNKEVSLNKNFSLFIIENNTCTRVMLIIKVYIILNVLNMDYNLLF